MGEDMLNGWGEIATFLKCSVMSCWRYERNGGMPVARLYSGKVVASKAEIRAWIAKTDAVMRAVKEDVKK
jgi:hypothetical protein